MGKGGAGRGFHDGGKGRPREDRDRDRGDHRGQRDRDRDRDRRRGRRTRSSSSSGSRDNHEARRLDRHKRWMYKHDPSHAAFMDQREQELLDIE
eukprot:4058695-Pyramimonas_sp.AAC.1